jgi:thymidylate kinase
MKRNRNREDLRQDILYSLGHPIIRVNITKEHLDSAINAAIKKIWRWHVDGSYECESANYPDLTRASILHLEYCQNKMPVPDLTIVLECPVEVTIEQVKAKAKRDYTDEKQDLHERNERLLRSTAEIYSNLRRHHPGVRNVWCADDQGKIRSIEEIAEMINTSVDLVMQNATRCFGTRYLLPTRLTA